MFKNIKIIDDPTKVDEWDQIFFKTAALWSLKSHDEQTKCGCALVKDKTTLSTGYNGFIRNIDDTVLPRRRPDKYPFMIHAEANAVYNCVRLGRSTLNAIAYITGPPCLDCLQMLYQCGIKEIKFGDISNPKMVIFSEKYYKILRLIGDKMSLVYVPEVDILCSNTIGENYNVSDKQ